jgi:hypothetical protein
VTIAEQRGLIRGVLEGRNGRLFLGDQDGFALEWFLSTKPFNRPLLEVWKRTLRRRARELRRRGIPYAFYLAPDAHSVYPEDLPEGCERAGRGTPGEQFLATMREIAGIEYIDPRPDLLAAKGALEIYRKTDSHWTQYGSFIAYKTLCRALRSRVTLAELEARDVAFEYRRLYGDLGVLVTPERSEEAPRAIVSRNPYERLLDNDGFDRTSAFETFCPGAPPTRLLLMRDSFMTDQFDYLGRSFGHVLCAGTTTRLFLDEIDRWKPDIVMSHVGERRLYSYQVDHAQDTFEDIFRSDFTSDRGRIAGRAMLLLSARRAPEALPLVAPFEEDPALRPDHAYVAAQVLHANGLEQRAFGAIALALEHFPARPSYRCLASKIHVGLGNWDLAFESIARALEVASYNGHYHQVFAYLLTERGEMATARQYLERVLEEIDDFAPLWQLQTIACNAVGDKSSAYEAIAQALTLDSSEPVFHTLARETWRN